MDQLRNDLIDRIEITHATAQDDRLRIEQVDDGHEALRETFVESSDHGSSMLVGIDRRRDLREGTHHPRGRGVLRFDGRPAQVLLETIRAPAITRPRRGVTSVSMRQTNVPPFASETVAAFVHDAIDHHPAADSGSQNHPEDHPMSGGSTVGRL